MRFYQGLPALAKASQRKTDAEETPTTKLTGPLLRVCEVRHSVAVGGDEEAARVLAQAQRGVLQLVVVEVAVEANNHGAHVMVVLHHHTGGQVDRLLTVLLRTRSGVVGV